MKRLKSIIKKDFGFTLVELLVVVSVVSIISSITLVNYRRGFVQHSLSQSNQKLLADLRKVQNMAISGVGIASDFCGYGININKSSDPYSYIIYVDKNSDCSISNKKYDVGDDIIEEVNLTNKIKINFTSPSPLDILFKPPEPLTYINQSNSLGIDASIVLEAEGFSLPTKTITVNTSGLIE